MDKSCERANLIGYSSRIDDIRFTNRQERDSKNLLISAFTAPLILIIACQIAAFFYTEVSRLAWLTIGVIMGLIVMLVLLMQLMKNKRITDFEGELVKTRVRRKSRGNADCGTYEVYYVHSLLFRGSDGKTHKYSKEYAFKKTPENSWFWYLQIGDKVRYHVKQNYFEKYDKSQDSLLPCAECHGFFDITLDHCPECGAVSIKP